MPLFASRPSVRLLILILPFLTINSCQEQEEYEKTATVKFDVAEVTRTEDVASVRIGVSLDHYRNENVILKAMVNTKDTATYREMDFQLTPELLLKPFDKTGYFQFSIINDKQIDLDDRIEVTLLPPLTGNLKLSDNPAEQKFNIIIKNNDFITPDKFQADLTWHRTKPEDKVNGINLDLYVQTNIIIKNGVITDIGKTFTASEEFSSFESINLFEKNPDQPYYIVTYFNLVFVDDVVTYTLTLNGFGFSDKNFGKVFADVDVGTAVIYGPFYKWGNKMSGPGRQTQSVNEYLLSKEELQKLGFRK